MCHDQQASRMRVGEGRHITALQAISQYSTYRTKKGVVRDEDGDGIVIGHTLDHAFLEALRFSADQGRPTPPKLCSANRKTSEFAAVLLPRFTAIPRTTP